MTTIEKAQKMIRSALDLLEKIGGAKAETVEKAIETADAAVTAAAEVTREEPKAPKAAVTAKAKAAGGINRSEVIREYFAKHGMSVRNKEVLDYIKKTYNTEVGPAHVSIIRKNMAGGKAVRTGKVKVKAAKATATAKAKTVTPKVSKPTLGQLPMGTLCASLLKKHGAKDGLKLSELTDLVLKSGYPYKGEKGRGGVLQIVYQALHTLSKEGTHVGYKGETPVIVKDPSSKRYKLNPKAKKG